MKEFYTHGSEAYAPIPVEVPSHLPEEPKKEQPLILEERKGISPITIVSGAVVLLLLGALLFSMVRLFEVRSERAELQRQINQLQTQKNRLIAQFESSIDMDAVAQRAEDMGMHIPWAEQVRYVNVELPETVKETTQEIQMGLVDAFHAMVLDMESYFS